MSESFFLPGSAEPVYLHVRDYLPDTRKYMEEMWLWFNSLGLADPDHRAQARNDFHQRFWEMYLARLLYEEGHPIKKVKGKGPDYTFTWNGKSINIEAIAPKAGDGPDAVPPLEQNKYHGTLPVQQLNLRLTSALTTKSAKYQKYIDDETVKHVNTDSCCVIAVSGRSISELISLNNGVPHICSALFGIGDMAISLDPETKESSKPFYQVRTSIAKASGKPVSTYFYNDPIHSHISGVLYSDADVMNRDKPLLLIANPNTTNPLPEGLFDFCVRYKIQPNGEDGFQLLSFPPAN